MLEWQLKHPLYRATPLRLIAEFEAHLEPGRLALELRKQCLYPNHPAVAGWSQAGSQT